MKIVDVKTIVVNARLRNWVFVKVVTDTPGLIGWGEASLEWKTRTVVGAVQDLSPLLIGEDPRRTEHLWQSMDRQQFFKGGIAVMSAISGIDQALHDIKAKDLNIPLHELLGGRVRDRVRMYDHLGGGQSDAVYSRASADDFGERARESVAAGFTALKILPIPRSAPLERGSSVRAAVALMQSVREAVGDSVDIMVDFHGRTTPAMAIRYGLAIAPLNPWFIEEPCQPENVAATAEVARALPVPIAMGERLTTRHQFVDVLQQRAAAVLQPDVCHCGGITELRKIAAMADAHYVSIAPHNPLGPLATMVNIQLALATPNFLIQEFMRSDVPWRDEVVDAPIEIRNGYAQLTSRPGIGVEIDERAAARHPYEPEPVVRWFHEDGSVADW